MGFGEGASALGAPKTAKAVPVLAETLASSFAIGTGHFDLRFRCALHALIILRALVVCKRKTAVNVKFLRCVFNGFGGQNGADTATRQSHGKQRTRERYSPCLSPA